MLQGSLILNAPSQKFKKPTSIPPVLDLNARSIPKELIEKSKIALNNSRLSSISTNSDDSIEELSEEFDDGNYEEDWKNFKVMTILNCLNNVPSN